MVPDLQEPVFAPGLRPARPPLLRACSADVLLACLCRSRGARRAQPPLLVLDASAALELLLVTERGREVVERISAPAETLHAPYLIDLEVVQVLRRYVLRRQLDEVRASQALEDLRDLDPSPYPHDVLSGRIWELRHNASAYDAAYLALAETLGALLLTSEARLREVPGVRVRIEVL